MPKSKRKLFSNCPNPIIQQDDVCAYGRYFGCDIDVIDNVPPPLQTCVSSYISFSRKFYILLFQYTQTSFYYVCLC